MWDGFIEVPFRPRSRVGHPGHDLGSESSCGCRIPIAGLASLATTYMGDGLVVRGVTILVHMNGDLGGEGGGNLITGPDETLKPKPMEIR